MPFCSQKAVTTEQVRKDEKQLSVLSLSSSDLKSRCNWANSHAINLLGISDQAPCFSKALKTLCRQLPISMGNSDFCFFAYAESWPWTEQKRNAAAVGIRVTDPPLPSNYKACLLLCDFPLFLNITCQPSIHYSGQLQAERRGRIGCSHLSCHWHDQHF